MEMKDLLLFKVASHQETIILDFPSPVLWLRVALPCTGPSGETISMNFEAIYNIYSCNVANITPTTDTVLEIADSWPDVAPVAGIPSCTGIAFITDISLDLYENTAQLDEVNKRDRELTVNSNIKTKVPVCVSTFHKKRM